MAQHNEQHRQNNESVSQSVAAYLYPDKIILVTINCRDEAVTYGTDDISVLPVGIAEMDLGKLAWEHISRSEVDEILFDYVKEFREAFRKKGKFKSEKAAMKDAKYVRIEHVDDLFTFWPYKNLHHDRGRKEFQRIPDKVFTITGNLGFESIALNLRKAWHSAEC